MPPETRQRKKQLGQIKRASRGKWISFSLMKFVACCEAAILVWTTEMSKHLSLKFKVRTHWDNGASSYRGVGRGRGVGLGLGVALGVALGVGVAVGVPVGVGLTVAVGVAVGDGVGVGP